MRRHSVQLLRITCFIEAVSFLVLLFVAMPIKYIGNVPSAVSVPGMIHGMLFVAFALFLAYATFVRKWHIKYPAALFVASLLPFAPFFFEKWLKREHEALQTEP